MKVATPPAWWRDKHERTMRARVKDYDGMVLHRSQRVLGEQASWAMRTTILPPKMGRGRKRG